MLTAYILVCTIYQCQYLKVFSHSHKENDLKARWSATCTLEM